MMILDVGGNDGTRCQRHYPNADITVLDLKHGWDVMKDGLPEGEWDVIFCNHIIEHVSDPDYLLKECRRVMKPHTILEIGTPNLTAWFNRILFLLGYVPHSVELSKQHNIGKPFNWNKEPLGGHIYVYTVPALKDLLSRNHFRIIECFGEASTFPCWFPIRIMDRALTSCSPNLASAFRLKCKLL